jgi:hypothetical protein
MKNKQQMPERAERNKNMDETTKTEGSTTINQYPNNNGWGGPWGGGWGGYGYPVAVPAYGYGNGFGGFGDMLRGFGGNINIGRGGGMAGTALGLGIGALTAVLAPAIIGRNGLFGGDHHCHDDFVTQRELTLVEKNNTLAAENGQLKAQIYTDNKTDSVIKTLVEWRQRQELIDNTAAAEIAALKQENANMKAQLGSMLGTYITPQTFAPSQAVYSQITAAQAAKTATASGS